MTWWMQLDNKKGSRPRCVLLMDGKPEDVAARLTRLVDLAEVVVSPDDKWMPYGKPVRQQDGEWDDEPAGEASLDKSNDLLSPANQQQLGNWWLAENPGNRKTPNWDIASTCKISGKKGLLLIEAKAHRNELGKRGSGAKDDNNRKRIGDCIEEAKQGLRKETSIDWNLSCDSYYQMSNRFAWSWKLTQLGFPVVLVYLGFLDANEMRKQGKPFTTLEEWKRALTNHSRPLFSEIPWGKEWTVNGQHLIPLIRAYNQPFPCPVES